MREIEFRGKRIGNGEWLVSKTVVRADGGFFLVLPDAEVYGDYGNKEGVTHLCCNRGFLAEVSPETVGQYTGMKDKNGNKIYEGDVAALPKFPNGVDKRFVMYDEGRARFIRRSPNCKDSDYVINACCCEDYEVIGNIYDNPELLEVQH